MYLMPTFPSNNFTFRTLSIPNDPKQPSCYLIYRQSKAEEKKTLYFNQPCKLQTRIKTTPSKTQCVNLKLISVERKSCASNPQIQEHASNSRSIFIANIFEELCTSPQYTQIFVRSSSAVSIDQFVSEARFNKSHSKTEGLLNFL